MVLLPENIITPSTPKLLQGCSDNSIAISGVSLLIRKGYLSEYALKSAMYLPAYLQSIYEEHNKDHS